MGCAVFGLLVLSVVSALTIYHMSKRVNEEKMYGDAMARARGIVPAQTWRVTVGKKTVEFEANDEGDAMRQILHHKIDPRSILTLVRVERPMQAGVPVSPLAGLAGPAKTRRRGTQRGQ